MSAKPVIGIVGAGSIGTGWAIVFAQAAHRVRVCDASQRRLAEARREVEDRLRDLEEFELLNESVETVLARISFHRELAETVEAADHVQECIPENLEAKIELFAELDALAAPHTVLATSSSFIPASQIAAGLPGKARVLVVHPANPPFLLRVAEVVPAPFTDKEVIDRTAELLRKADMAPVRLNREIEGFAFNRLQGAMLREAYCLVRDGILSVGDLDQLVRDGLGLRWSVIGPFETSDLNTRGGIAAHAARMGPAYHRMGLERGQDDPWGAQIVEAVTAARRQAMPLEQWQEQVAKRDRALMALLRLRRQPVG